MVTPGSQMGYAVEPTDLWELESDVFYFSILSLWLTLQILTSISLLASDFFSWILQIDFDYNFG